MPRKNYFNPRLKQLAPYPFARLASLLGELHPPESVISLAAGEPTAESPQSALDALQQHAASFNRYPSGRGIPSLRRAAADWLTRRFQLDTCPPDPDSQVVPVCGTREGLFSLIHTLANPKRTLIFANPFYQIYGGAAVLAGMNTAFLPSARGKDLRQIPAALWGQCAALVLCNPHNPTGCALSQKDLLFALEIADKHGFPIIADECYSDTYLDENAKPAGLLAACAASGRTDWRNCMVLHSLSKRSSLAGLRSGFAAGDAEIVRAYLHYRSYHGSTMPEPVQHASVTAWNDDDWPRTQRAQYRERFDAFDRAAGKNFHCSRPDGGFYYWMQVPPAWRNDDEAFARDLYSQAGLHTVPGSYLGHTNSDGTNPGKGYMRLALVAEPKMCAQAGERMKIVLEAGPAKSK